MDFLQGLVVGGKLLAAEDFDVVILHELDDARGDRPIALSPFWLFE